MHYTTSLLKSRDNMVPGTTELLQKLSQAETEEDKEAVKAAIVGGTITAINYTIFSACVVSVRNMLSLVPRYLLTE